MTQTSNRFYDRVARLMNDAASVAQGVRREATTMFRSQAERIANDMDLVRREDFEAVQEMARLAREQNTKLEARIAKLEAELAKAGGAKSSGGSRTASRSSGTGTRRRSAAPKKTEVAAKDTGADSAS